MDELSEQIGRILSDPEQMAQLSSLAESLGLSQSAAQNGEENASDAALLQKLLPQLMQQSSREAQLFEALRPFLSEKHRQRVDRAIRAARLSRLAKAAVQQLGSGSLPGLL